MKNAILNQRIEKRKIWISSFIKGDKLLISDEYFANYFIFNAFGKFQMEGTVKDDSSIDVQTLARGIYFIEFTFADNSKVTKQFMKY